MKTDTNDPSPYEKISLYDHVNQIISIISWVFEKKYRYIRQERTDFKGNVRFLSNRNSVTEN